ncbi:MAG: hypothetical protein IKK94_06205 [Clostridia bacterium]|nr:hypothetical protein [Clostridia bacterium]
MCNQPFNGDTVITEDAVFYIGLNNDCLGAESNEPETVRGTITENCFYIITITDDGNVAVTGFGNGETRTYNYS